MDIINHAFKTTPRENFLSADVAGNADADEPLPIGFGQTNSQPSTVRMMLEWLEVEPGNKILDVGSGSGWTTALLASMTGSKGHIYAVEAIAELEQFGRENCQRLGIKNAGFHRSGNVLGLPQFAPYDRILVSASASELPDELLAQLKVDGKMVIPVHNDIFEVTKTAKDQYQTTSHAGFAFVPLV